jgi:site-specific recombinase XerD
VQWIKRFILFHDKRHPLELGAGEVAAFLSHLAVKRNVAAPTQNQALNAILFLYRDVLKCTLQWLEGVQRAKKPQRLPVVLSRDEVRALLAQMAKVRKIASRCLPQNLFEPLRNHLVRVRALHENDLRDGVVSPFETIA